MNIHKITYDKFEQRIYMKYCNGAETYYSYDSLRRQLKNLAVYTGKDERRAIMNNAYTFDAVGNILSVSNNAPIPEKGQGGQMKHSYVYDDLYRLTAANGTYTSRNSKTAAYNLAMKYDKMGRILQKKQHISQQNVQFNGKLFAGYDLDYSYDQGKTFLLSNISDKNYRSEKDTTSKIDNNHKYSYDDNGNLIYVVTAQGHKDSTNEKKVNERMLKWDEENRLLAINDNGFISSYWYDSNGERTVKESGYGELMYVNSEFSGGRTGTNKFTLYVNPYFVASQGGHYTKHIYIGSQRIVSKLGDLASYGADPRRIEYAGSESDDIEVNYAKKYVATQQTIKQHYKDFKVPYHGLDNNDYVYGSGFCCDDTTKTHTNKSLDPKENDNPELYQYYYHSDHLGSSSYITNLDGEVAQHIEYVPFGEVFLEEKNDRWNTPYLFNGKELDEETGLYYYGARYYDSRISLWISVDPMAEKYVSLTAYNYVRNNPTNSIDPNGMDIDDPPVLNLNLSLGTGGFKANVNFSFGVEVGDFKTFYGLGITYHSDFFNTGKSGVEFRNSFMLNYDDGITSTSLGTNFWNGTGGLQEFSQRTGMFSIKSGAFNFSYENDGTPFQYKYMPLGDGGDSYRTAAASIGYKDFSVNMNLITGLRNKLSFIIEELSAGGEKGIPQGEGSFGETYKHGFVFEQGPQYRYGGLSLNYQGISGGVNSEWIRHAFQNVFAHDFIKPQRQFKMLNDNWKPIFNMSTQGSSKFTIWGQ